ncbi:hypothetical protein D3C73_1447720 [compost metagenome]
MYVDAGLIMKHLADMRLVPKPLRQFLRTIEHTDMKHSFYSKPVLYFTHFALGDHDPVLDHANLIHHFRKLR